MKTNTRFAIFIAVTYFLLVIILYHLFHYLFE